MLRQQGAKGHFLRIQCPTVPNNERHKLRKEKKEKKENLSKQVDSDIIELVTDLSPDIEWG